MLAAVELCILQNKNLWNQHVKGETHTYIKKKKEVNTGSTQVQHNSHVDVLGSAAYYVYIYSPLYVRISSFL